MNESDSDEPKRKVKKQQAHGDQLKVEDPVPTAQNSNKRIRKPPKIFEIAV